MRLSCLAAFVCTVILVALPAQPLFGGSMVLNWDMDTLNGAQVADISANSNDGTFIVHDGTYTRMETGGPFAASPAYYTFSPTNNGTQIAAAPDSSVDVQEGDYSFSIWFKDCSGGGPQMALSRYDAKDGGRGFYFYIDGATAYLAHFVDGATYNYFGETITGDLSAWHHAVGIFEEGVGSTLWIDGVKSVIANDTTAVSGPKPESEFSAAANASETGGTHYPIYGGIDEVKLFNYALSDTEVTLLYQTNSWVPEPSTLTLLGMGIGMLAMLSGWRRRR